MATPIASNAATVNDAFPMSREAFQSILDQLQRLDSEMSSLRPQVEELQAENRALKEEVDALRGERSKVPSPARPTAAGEPPPKQPEVRSSSRSLSYASHTRMSPNEGNEDSTLDDETEVPYLEEPSSPPEIAQIPKDEDTISPLGSSASTRRASQRKRKAPTQADAGWEAPRPHLAKKARRSAAGEKTPVRLKTAKISIPRSSRPSDTPPRATVTFVKGEPAMSEQESLASSSHPPESPGHDTLLTATRTKFPANEIKTDSLKIDESVANQLLTNIPTLKAQPPPLKLQIPIALLQKEFGAATQGLLWHNSTKKGIQPSNVRRFLFPGFDTNPEMPAAPGEPGLLLCGRVEMLTGIWSLFSRVPLKSSSLKRWNYCGEYESEVVGSLSAQNFADQPARVRQKWGKKIAHHKKHLPYVEMRARMTLRKEGKEVDKANMKVELESIKSMPKTQSKLTAQDVIDAFESGEESIPIVRMQCVAYNRAFAEELCAKS